MLVPLGQAMYLGHAQQLEWDLAVGLQAGGRYEGLIVRLRRQGIPQLIAHVIPPVAILAQGLLPPTSRVA